jgi:hypothetical protein
MQSANEYLLGEIGPLPDDWQQDNPDLKKIGGSDLKGVGRSETAKTLKRSGGGFTVGGRSGTGRIGN